LIRNLLKVKLPFEPSTPAQAAGIAALADREFLRRSVELNTRGLRRLTAALEEMGLPFAPPEANFVMIVLRDEAEADRVFREMLAQGVVVRPLRAFGLPNCLRISTGTDEDNLLCVEALRRSYAASIGASPGD
jgi:histidinol-phosphate aminotransferase